MNTLYVLIVPNNADIVPCKACQGYFRRNVCILLKYMVISEWQQYRYVANEGTLHLDHIQYL